MSSLSRKKWAMLFGNLVLHVPGYLAINAYLSRQGVSYDLAIGLDYKIPFIKYFAPFYSIVYLIPVAAFFVLWNSYEGIKAAAKAFAGSGVVCFAGFLLLPVEYRLRVELHPPYDFFTNILRFFYWADAPYNCFPSMHVSLAFISAAVVHRFRPRLAPIYYLLATIISLSILFMKQHYILDLAGGLGVSWLMTAMFVPKASGYESELLEPATPV